MPKLGVNIDHVATLRQARKEDEPDPLAAAQICKKAGANSIVCHLREDRRHINDQDVKKLRRLIKRNLTLEMALDPQIIKLAVKIKPDHAMFVPEKREEITTEGGLNVIRHSRRISQAIHALKTKGIMTSLFIDPVKSHVRKAKDLAADIIELHTGPYAHAKSKSQQKDELHKLTAMTELAKEYGLIVNAGHGLKYFNTRPVAKIKGIDELNIGHSIISYAVFVGLEKAVKTMLQLVK